MEPIIFDFNGTMFQDTVENIKAWTELIYRETGYTVSKEDFRQHINGVPDVDIIRYFLKIPGPMAKLEYYANEKEKIYRELCLRRHPLELLAGLPEFLDYLVAHQVSINIATGADKGNVNFYLKYLHLDKWFDPQKIVFSDGSFPGKPSPDIYIMAAERIGVNIKDCLVFEDAWLGVQAAKNAGAKRIIGLFTNPEGKFLYTMPGIERVITDFTCWRDLLF